MSGSLLLSGDPVTGIQSATKHYVDVLAATELALAGGTMGGTLNAPNAVTKLPRVDVRHPDFGVGCANAADQRVAARRRFVGAAAVSRVDSAGPAGAASGSILSKVVMSCDSSPEQIVSTRQRPSPPLT